jgi:hypothetical protein
MWRWGPRSDRESTETSSYAILEQMSASVYCMLPVVVNIRLAISNCAVSDVIVPDPRSRSNSST